MYSCIKFANTSDCAARDSVEEFLVLFRCTFIDTLCSFFSEIQNKIHIVNIACWLHLKYLYKRYVYAVKIIRKKNNKYPVNSLGGKAILRPVIGLWLLLKNHPTTVVFVKFIVWCLTENLALHEPAWQNSTYMSYTGAERAVDGKYSNLHSRGGRCAASDLVQTTAEWRVDLGAVRSIHHIVIQYATGNIVYVKLIISVTFINIG